MIASRMIAGALLCLALNNCATEDEKEAPAPLEELYMVGDATPVGWNIQEPEPLVRDAANPYLWHWQGILYSGEVKFPTYKGTWSADYFMPLEPAEKDLSLTSTKLVVNGTPDNKWMLTQETAGEYKITIDTKTPAIHFEKLPAVAP